MVTSSDCLSVRLFTLDIYHYPVGRLSTVCLILFQDCAFNKLHSSSALRVGTVFLEIFFFEKE